MLLPAVFILSLSSLSFEVILTRVFAISQWNHLSFMVISIALFGFAASGTLFSILEARKSRWANLLFTEDSVAVLLTLYSMSAIGSFIVLNSIPLDYVRLPFEPVQAVYLFIVYLLLALPFFFTGLTICIGYAYCVEKTGLTYFLNMLGSALGALLPALLLPLMGEEKNILLVSCLPLLVTPILKGKIRQKIRPVLIWTAIAVCIVSAILSMSKASSIIRVAPSSYKALSQTLRFPHTRIVDTRSGLRGRMDLVESPYIRFAPGLSLKYRHTLPEQAAVYRDGDAPLTLYRLGSPNDARFSTYTIAYAGYLLPERIDNVLIILKGGGSAVPCAVASNAKEITVVEQIPYLAEQIEKHYSLSAADQPPRAFLATCSQRFSVIHIENWGPSLPGTAALNQVDLFTVEAFIQYLTHLAPDGVLICTRKLLLPPTDSVRLWAVAYRGLKDIGIHSPARHIAMLRNWDTYVLMVSKKPLDDLTRLKTFAEDMNFDPVYLPGISKHAVNRFNIFDAPFHYLETSRLAAAYRYGTEKIFYGSYPFDVAPQSDNRPFPNRYLRWKALKTQYESKGSRFYALFLSGEIVVAVVFFEALGISLLLLGAPLVGIRKVRRPTLAACVFFLGVGAGFMFVELYFIKLYTGLTGDPIIGFTLVLGGILISSSAGGFWTQRLDRKSLGNALAVIVVTFALSAFINPRIVDALLGFSGSIRLLMGFLLLFPFGFLMGIPFPLGMRYLFDAPAHRAYGWSINGCASILTSIVAAQIALSFGICQIMLCGSVSYLAALICVLKTVEKN